MSRPWLRRVVMLPSQMNADRCNSKGVLLLNAETKAFMAHARRPRGVFFVSFSRVSFIVSGVVRDRTVLSVCIKRRRKKTLSRASYLHFRDRSRRERRGGSQTCTQLRAQIRAESVFPRFSPHIPSCFRGAPNSSENIVGSHFPHFGTKPCYLIRSEFCFAALQMHRML